jgi:hypothetical protein
MKSCAPVVAAVLLLVEFELEAGELLVLDAGGVVALFAVLLVVVVLVVFVVVLALPGAVEVHPAVASSAAVKPHSNTLFFIFTFSLSMG